MDTPQQKAIAGMCRPSRLHPSFAHPCAGCARSAWFPRSTHQNFAKNPQLVPLCSMCFFTFLLQGHIAQVQLVDQTPEEIANDTQCLN